ncbi:FliA/WhiG family RNA polymerase sigma factor [Bacillus sp. FJAT-42376]|uniref:FliA/WhiG family RNA polymerase sigma factor n=1 Tax=Bacillus sp. FJAT-42376 TaxID=2014076 RepID=UPI000F4F29A7|nr:FliA/WhiG family RNA polymerase sigma factor [Bacillus sp. FJAT-42376]AZB42962.1 FliA/WhiG family RNA polymerase sigma factor [Bacillus sp. FJAT-42376]
MTQLTGKEEQQIWNKWVSNRDPLAGDALIKRYTPLVTFHVQRISVGLPKTVSRDDLMSLGLYGLYDALEKFDPGRDLKFDTYASFRIRGAIIDGLRKEDWLPRSSREKAKRVETVIEKLEQKYLRNVTPGEIAKEMGMTEDEVLTAVNEGFFANVLSIDEYLPDHDDGDYVGMILKDERSETPEENLLKQEMIGQLSDVIGELSEKEQLVVSLFYKEELTLTEIGHVMNLSTSRISQIHSKALFKLRRIMEKFMN